MAIVKAAADRKIGVVPAEDFKAIAGRGAQGTVNGETYRLGNRFVELFSNWEAKRWNLFRNCSGVSMNT